MSYKTYENYKDSMVDWIGDIPEHWDLARFKIFYSYIKGKNPKEVYDENGEGRVPYLSMDFLRNKSVAEFVLVEECSVKANNGDILLLWDGSNAGEFVISEFGAVSSTMAKLIPNIQINKNYSKYLCRFIEPLLRELTIGMGVPHVNTNELNNIIIPFVDIIEQEKIAGYLDKKTSEIDENIAKNKELISLLEEKKTALINQAVTKGLNPNVPMKDSGIEWIGEIPEHWVIKKLKYCVDLNSSSLSENTDDYYEFDYVDISSVSLEKGIEKYEHMYFKDSPSRARRIVKKDDIIVSTVRTYLKAIAVIPDKKDVIVSTGFAVLTPRNINSSFLAYLTKSNYFVNLVSAHSVGVSYPAINSSVLVNLKIVIPPTEEQEKCSDYLEKEISKIDEIIEKNNEEIELLEEYKTSLIHHVVTGKIDVRDEI